MNDVSSVACVDLFLGGHHRMYIELLAEQWMVQSEGGTLEICVPRAFAHRHPDLVSRLENLQNHRLRLVFLDIEPAAEGVTGMRQLLRNDRLHAAALAAVAERKPKHVVFLYFDHAQLAVARFRGRTPKVSGIYFRAPTENAHSLARRATQIRKWLMLGLCVSSQSFHRLFCLDPEAAIRINAKLKRDAAVHLPDGITIAQADVRPPDLRRELNIHQNAIVFLFFGALGRSKGLLQTFAAWPSQPDGRAHLLIAGRIPPEEADLAARTREFCQRPDVTWLDSYVPEERVTALFDACDVVLVPYQNHIGSSNVLIRAAFAGKPVIGSDFDMVGRQIRARRLGLAVDCTDTNALAAAIRAVADSGACEGFDPSSAHSFGTEHLPSKMVGTLLRALGL